MTNEKNSKVGKEWFNSLNDEERFVVFTRFLLKYLERKDQGLHMEVISIVRMYARHYVKNEPGYENGVRSLKLRIKSVVGEYNLRHAGRHFVRYLEYMQKNI